MNAARWVVFVLLIIGAAYLVYRMPRSAPPPATTPSAPVAVTFYCMNGDTIQASFATSSVALVLSDGRAFVLPQTRSGSGARYEASTTAEDIVFWNKGDGAFITEGDKTTYRDCTAAYVTPSDAPGYELYEDQGKTFTFAFPSNFSVVGNTLGYTTSWSELATTSGMALARIGVPKSFEPNTNFVEAWFSVGASSNPSAVATCLTNPDARGTTATTTFGGTTYTKIDFSGAAAGNRYDTTSYRTLRDGECYAIEYTIHYGVFENYPSGTVARFDEKKVQAALDEVARSFYFLQ